MACHTRVIPKATIVLFKRQLDNSRWTVELEYKDDFQERKAKRLNIDELKKRAMYAPKKPGTRPVSSKGYERNAYVSEYAKRRANGICQLCEQPAPFKDGVCQDSCRNFLVF